ncbi:MAG: hypothetical protein Q4G67_03275 [Actinomycetia bacterium]|nr:hypothetical protein [Actinomycetes bacterium]
MVGRPAARHARTWESADTAGGPGTGQTWTSAFSTSQYAELDSALLAALARADRAAALAAEIEGLTRDVAAGRARISAKRRALTDVPVLARDVAADVLQLLGRVAGQAPPPPRGPRRADQRRARLAAQVESVQTQVDRLASAQDELADLATPQEDVRAAARAKAERILSDRAEGWEQVRDLLTDVDRGLSRSEQLRTAHDSLQQVIHCAAAALGTYEAVRMESVLAHEEAPHRLEDATEAATAATEELLAAAEAARFAVRHLDLRRRIRLPVDRRLRLRRIPGPFVAPTTAQLNRLVRETRRLSRRAEHARVTVRTAAKAAARDLQAAEAALVAVMKRPF